MFSDLVDELIGLSDNGLADRIEANELELRRLGTEQAAALAVAKRRNLHGAEGHRTMAAYCRATLNWSTAEASRRLGLARAVDEVPGLGEAWMAGRFGLPQASKLAAAHSNPRVRDRLGAVANQLLMNAEQMPYCDFATVVDHVVECADDDGAHDDRDRAIEGRRALVVDVGGALDIAASGGDGLIAAEMIAIHQWFCEIEFRKDLEANRLQHGDLADGFSLPRTDRQRRFDALVAIFRASAAANDAGVVGRAAEPLVNIVIDAGSWGRLLLANGLSSATDLDGRRIDPFTGLAADDTDSLLDDLTSDSTGRCETTSGQPRHPHDVMRAALAGRIRRTVVDSDRVIIDLGRRQRLFTGSARQAAMLLIRRCEHAGCEMPSDWCEVDHVVPWAAGTGRTDQRNAAVLCRVHNNEKQRSGWRTRRARNGCSYTVRPDGTIVMPIGARPPDLDDHDSDDRDPDDDDWDDIWGDDSPETHARLTAVIRDRCHAIGRDRIT